MRSLAWLAGGRRSGGSRGRGGRGTSGRAAILVVLAAPTAPAGARGLQSADRDRAAARPATCQPEGVRRKPPNATYLDSRAAIKAAALVRLQPTIMAAGPKLILHDLRIGRPLRAAGRSPLHHCKWPVGCHRKRAKRRDNSFGGGNWPIGAPLGHLQTCGGSKWRIWKRADQLKKGQRRRK